MKYSDRLYFFISPDGVNSEMRQGIIPLDPKTKIKNKVKVKSTLAAWQICMGKNPMQTYRQLVHVFIGIKGSLRSSVARSVRDQVR